MNKVIIALLSFSIIMAGYSFAAITKNDNGSISQTTTQTVTINSIILDVINLFNNKNAFDQARQQYVAEVAANNAAINADGATLIAAGNAGVQSAQLFLNAYYQTYGAPWTPVAIDVSTVNWYSIGVPLFRNVNWTNVAGVSNGDKINWTNFPNLGW